MGSAASTVPAGPGELPETSDSTNLIDQEKVRTFKPDDLRLHTYAHQNHSYISVLSDVYDVSADRDFHAVDGRYSYLVGYDASRAIALDTNRVEDIESFELKDLNEVQLKRLKERKDSMDKDKSIKFVGRLVIPADLDLKELKEFDGLNNLRGCIYIALNGNIYDVTANGRDFYGPDGSYHQFAGRDASSALAYMSFDPEHLDNPNIDSLSAEKRRVLMDWCVKFHQKYVWLGRLKS